MQSILKIGSALAERAGRGQFGGCHPVVDIARRLLQLAVEKPGQCLVGHSSAFFTNGPRKHFFCFVGAPFLTF